MFTSMAELSSPQIITFYLTTTFCYFVAYHWMSQLDAKLINYNYSQKESYITISF